MNIFYICCCAHDLVTTIVGFCCRSINLVDYFTKQWPGKFFLTTDSSTYISNDRRVPHVSYQLLPFGFTINSNNNTECMFNVLPIYGYRYLPSV